MVAKSGKKKRKLNSKTVRQMLHWAHYRFKPWNLRVCLKGLPAQCSILRTVFKFNLRFFFPDLATIWDDSKVGIKITLWLGC